MMKRIVCALLAVALGISVCGFAMAETGHFTVNGTGSYSNLKDAVAAASKSGTTTIKLEGGDLEGCAVSIPLEDPKDKKGFDNLIIDFGGHTYTVTEPFAGSTGTETQAMQLLKGSTITLQNGTLKGKQNSEKRLKMMIQNYANLTLRDFTVDASNIPEVAYVCSNNNGDVLYTGNTSILAAPGKVAFDVCGFSNTSTYPGPTVTVDTTGTIDGIVEYSYNTAHSPDNVKLVVTSGHFTQKFNPVNNPENEGIQISGGTFAKKPEDNWMVSGMTPIRDDGAGHYVIEKKESLSVDMDFGDLYVDCIVDENTTTPEQQNAEYTFTLKLTGDVAELQYAVTNSQERIPTFKTFDFSQGTLRFTLKNGDWLYVYHLPVGTQYEVVETNANGCIVDVTNAKGAISEPYYTGSGSERFLVNYSNAMFVHSGEQKPVTPTPAPATPTPAPTTTAPKTGDSTPIALYSLCAVLALACAAWMAKRRKA